MRDVTVPWSYLFEVPKPPITPRMRELVEPAILLVLMLVPLLVPMLTPALFFRVVLAGLLLSAPLSVPFMLLAVTGKGAPAGAKAGRSRAGRAVAS